MNRFPSPLRFAVLASMVWLAMLACRTSNLAAQDESQATSTRAPRPTFTSAPPTSPPTAAPTETAAPTDTPPPAATSRAPRPRPAPTHTFTPAPPPPPPTEDPYQGYTYRVARNTCASSPGPNTQIVGTVYEHGNKTNGVLVRVSPVPGGPAAIPDFTTGVDPNDPNHKDDSLRGQYQLGLANGGFLPGNWFVFVVDNNGNQRSVSAPVHTDGKTGCNIATIDFANH